MDEWTVSPEENGLEALALLQQRLPAAPRGYLRQLLRRGRITGDGSLLEERTVVRSGDRLVLPGSQRLQALLAEAAAVPTILCETGEALIVDKPAGLAVHRGAGHEADNLTERVRRLLAGRGQSFRCAPVHRLDAGTSGPVLFGKGRRAIAAFGEVFMTRPVDKRYLALVTGRPPAAGSLDEAVPVRGRLRPALTQFARLATDGDHALLELRLLTGRRHQIRRQLAAAGWPVAGDRRYGGSALPGLERLFLHCHRLELPNPFGSEPLRGHSPLPASLADFLSALGGELAAAGRNPSPSSVTDQP